MLEIESHHTTLGKQDAATRLRTKRESEQGVKRCFSTFVVAIEATPISCIDHGVRAIEALGR